MRAKAGYRFINLKFDHLRGIQYPPVIDAIPTHMTRYEKHALYKLAKSLPSGSKLTEIGSYHGASSSCLAAGIAGTTSILHCIDTFMNDHVSDERQDTLMIFQQNTASYAMNLCVHRGFSHDVVSEIGDGIDLLFIDGDHSWKGISTDLELYLPLLKHQAILAMHDVAWGGCQRALHEIVLPLETKRLVMLPNLYAGRIRKAL